MSNSHQDEEENDVDLNRHVEHDLSILVGEEKKQYNYNSGHLAMLSSFIDGALNSTMKESVSKTLSFPEIEPNVWEDMMGFLEHERLITAEEAIVLCPFYDKYGFDAGTRLCDSCFLEVFDNASDVRNFDEIATAYACAYECSLTRSKKKGDKYFNGVLKNRNKRQRLSLADLSCLKCAAAESDLVWKSISNIIGRDAMPSVERRRCIRPLFSVSSQDKDRISRFEQHGDSKRISIRGAEGPPVLTTCDSFRRV